VTITAHTASVAGEAVVRAATEGRFTALFRTVWKKRSFRLAAWIASWTSALSHCRHERAKKTHYSD
jgi:hypothetical protein